MDTQHISPRMLEAGIEVAHELLNRDHAASPAELATAVYLAMRGKLVESRGGEPKTLLEAVERAVGAS